MEMAQEIKRNMARGNWTDSECFYVDAVDGGRCVLLAGPFQTLTEAESHTDKARQIACEIDSKAGFYSFGCSKWKHGHREGILNSRMGI